MRQAIHIFRKDVRHCWPYIAGVIAISAVYAWQESRVMPDLPNFAPSLTGILLTLLMVLAWWLAIGAAVHGESPIGDRQFWTTRPYSWKSLLTAKLLCVAAFLMLPLFLSDCVILLASAYNPLTLFPGLLWRQCWLLAFLMLPFVLAALTRATRELVLAGLVFYVVACLGLAVLSSHAANGTAVVYFGRASWTWDAARWLVSVTGFALVVWQYARRRTILVRVFAIALGGLAPFVTVMSLGRTALPDPAYPAAREDDPRYRNITVQLAADSIDRRSQSMLIPVKFSGWPRDLMTYQLLKVSATAPETGSQVWTSVDNPRSSMTTTNDGRDLIWLSVNDPGTMWPKTVDLRLSVYFRFYQRQGRADMQPDGGWSRVTGFGNVKWLEDAHGSHLIWRTALKPGPPGWTYSLSDGRSDLVTDAEWPGVGIVWPASPAWFAMSPVYSYAASGLTEVHASVVRARVPRRLVFTTKRLVYTRLYSDLKIPNVRLTHDETK